MTQFKKLKGNARVKFNSCRDLNLKIFFVLTVKEGTDLLKKGLNLKFCLICNRFLLAELLYNFNTC